MIIENINILELKNLKEEIKRCVEDTRIKRKTNFKLWDILTTAIVSVFANANTFDEIQTCAKEKYAFFKSFLQLTNGIPQTSNTYENIIGIINPKDLMFVTSNFIYRLLNVTENSSLRQDIIGIDGKVDCTSGHYGTKPLNVLNAYSNNLGISLYSIAIEDKSNEIPAFKDIVKYINVKGNILTVDALNTQTENAKIVNNMGGDYVFAVKGNQPTLYDDLVTYFNDEDLLKRAKWQKQTSKENGNIITREYYQTDDIEWLEEKEDWQGLRTIGCIIKTIEKSSGEITVEIRYYISSLEKDIEIFSNAIRKHWGVENNLHWQLDYTFRCDENRTSNKSALFNLQLIKKLVLNLIKLIKEKYSKKSIAKIRYMVSLNIELHISNIFNYLRQLEKENGFSVFDKLFDT